MSEYISKDIYKKVPLDYSKPDGRQIEIYARDLYKKGNEDAELMVFFAGGPGLMAPRNIGESWLKYALEHFHLVIVDQRGSDRSSRIGPETPAMFDNAQELAEYLSHFRADNIVRDAEVLRKEIYGGVQWYSAGQSYGGFITCSYLSFAPEGLKGSIITGGLPPFKKDTVDGVYKANLENVYARNKAYYQAYPEDAAKVKNIVNLLQEKPLKLAENDTFTAERFLEAGMILGVNGAFDKLHASLENPYMDSSESQVSWAFATKIKETDYETNPIFAFLHELIYCDGNRKSNWAAERCMAEDPRFALDNEEFICLRGECVRSGMFDDYAMLRPFKEAAEILAQKEDWPALYDFEQLAQNKVPVEAMVYDTDFYVDLQGSLDCADAIQGCNVSRHPTLQHNSLTTHSETVLSILYGNILRRTQG